MSYALNYSQLETDRLIEKLKIDWESKNKGATAPDFSKSFKVFICDHALAKHDQERIVLVNNSFYAKYDSVKSFDDVSKGIHIAHNPCGPAVHLAGTYYKRWIYNGMNCTDADAYMDMMFGRDVSPEKVEFKIMMI